LDLKFHDIPNTAAHAVAAAARLGADLCTVHASGGADMLRACQREAGNTRLLAVTVLTSFDKEELAAAGIGRTLPEQVLAMARLACECNLAGVICAPTDLAVFSNFPPHFLKVTPGIRPKGSAGNDQKRVLTPAEAVAAGATHIVVGRPVTTSPDPLQAATAILKEMEAAAK